MGLIDRLRRGRPTRSESDSPIIRTAPKRLLETNDAPKSLVPATKSSSLSLLPRGAYGPAYQFFSPDGGSTLIDISDGPMVFAFVAYWHVACRWKATKTAEAPLMIVDEDAETGNEEWLSEHELAPILEEPSPDYDMGELLECTSYYLDNTSAALWTLDKNKSGEIVRITPFSRNQFQPLLGTDDDGLPRLYAAFEVMTMEGTQLYLAEDVCFFRDSFPLTSSAWGRGKSRLDIAMSWLKLGLRAQQSVYDILNNAVWPSLAIVPDKDWDPDDDTFKMYQAEVGKYAQAGSKGKPFLMMGGGTVQQMQSTIKDLLPSEVLNRVESVISAISGVPAVVLQFEVGLQNSPWSQMGQARRMAYEDTIEPLWKKLERTMTRQVLRPVDDNTSHYIRFDRSNVAALTKDQFLAAETADKMGRLASLNERRAVLGLEPSSDPKADEIPELTQPTLTDLLAGAGGKPNVNSANGQDATSPTDPTQEQNPTDAPTKQFLARQLKTAALLSAFRQEQQTVWQMIAAHNLAHDADSIASIVDAMITPAVAKSRESKARGKDRTMSAVSKYLNEEGKQRWTKTVSPVALRSAQRAGAVTAADMNFNYNLIHNQLTTFASKQTQALISGVNKTTQSLVNDIVQGGLDENRSSKEIAQLIRDATGFDKARAELIARTETTKAFNGAPTDSLAALSKATGVVYTKTWSGVLDDRERDEHVAMEGETVNVDEAFSNGLDYPSEPNCRCTLLFAEASDQ